MKNILTASLLLFCAVNLTAQSFCKNQDIYTASGVPPHNDIAATPDGGYVVCGDQWRTSPANYDVAVQKFSASGYLEWSTSYGINANTTEESGGIAVATNGEYVAAGRSDAYVFATRIDATGAVVWSHQIYTGNAASGIDVVGTMDNGCAIAGITFSLTNPQDMYVVKLDSNGLIQWTAVLGDSSTDYCTAIDEDALGNIVVSGYTYGTPAQPGKNLVVAKLSPAGALTWCYQYASAFNIDDYTPGSVICAENCYYISGYIDTAYNTSLYGLGFLIQLDFAGNVISAKATNHTGVLFKDMHRTQQNTLIFAGIRFTLPGNYRGIILETDTSFNPIWYSVNTMPYFTDNRGITQINNGNYVLSGCYDSASYVGFTVTGISNHTHCCGSTDTLSTFSYSLTRSPFGIFSTGGIRSSGSAVAQANGYHAVCGSETGIPEASSSTEQLAVYPNPSSSTVTVNAQQKIVRYELVNLQGQIVRSSPANSTTLSIAIDGLAPGIYILNAYTDQQALRAKVQVE